MVTCAWESMLTGELVNGRIFAGSELGRADGTDTIDPALSVAYGGSLAY